MTNVITHVDEAGDKDSNILLPKVQLKDPFVPEYIYCADLSLRQPGFAVLSLAQNGRIRIVSTSVCDNKHRRGSHGTILVAIAKHMRSVMKSIPEQSRVTFVRERAFSRFANETMALNKVVGLADYLLAQDFIGKGRYVIEPRDWNEIAPRAVKCVITGSGNATKIDIQRSLPVFVGVYDYKTNDESDAVAVGVAYLMRSGLGRPLHAK